MKILFVSSEVDPFSKTGGLGDVCGALPRALAARGHQVVTVSPLYRGAAVEGRQWETRGSFWFWLFGQHHEGRFVVSQEAEGLEHVLVYNPMFERDGIYGDSHGVFGDNQLRFALLSRAALEVPRAVALWGQDEPPGAVDILHAHDWQGALAPLFHQALYKPLGLYPGMRSVMTVHNAAHQGVYPIETLGGLDVPPRHRDAVAFGGALNTLKAGLTTADAVTAVSPTFAGELQTAAGGFGLDPIFRQCAAQGKLAGILNGVDTVDWDPATDPFQAAHYSAGSLEGKAVCKAALQAELGLPVRPEVPLFGVVSRLDWQKGIDLLLEGSPMILDKDVQFAVLGLGDPKLHDGLLGLQAMYPERFAVRLAKDFPLARRIYGGSDFFVVPSLFEPCGLTQMYAMRYGAPPIVRATGGLRDSVQPWDPATGAGTGWTFEAYDAWALAESLGWAAHTFTHYPDSYAAIQRNGMMADWSWDRAASDFEALYAGLLAD